MRSTPHRVLAGIDTGGTFTDVVIEERGRLVCVKIPSTPRDPSRAVAAGLAALGRRPQEIVHGTTVATNALLERRGARTALVTTEGFEDVIAIGRQTRPSLYDLDVNRPPPLVPARLRLGVRERCDARGRPIRRPSLAELGRCAARLKRSGVRSVAICFLHSYASSTNERLAARKLGGSAPFICTSSGILPEHREFERFSTTVLSAYLTPVLHDYLQSLGRRNLARVLRILRSDGTTLGTRAASREAAGSLLSGPAGGVIASAELGHRLGTQKLLTLDMGGTSTEVCLLDGEPTLRRRWQVGGWPVALPSLAIDTVGAGGGSIAHVDAGGILRVGPQSAGADPGPVCWGRGNDLTVTDAHLFLRRLDAGTFASQGLPLYTERVHKQLTRLARRLHVTPERAAEGVLKVVEAEMERALRRISVEQGHDPRHYSLVAFGGAGGLHAVSLARRLGCRRVLIPPSPGTFSALGLLLSRPSVERSATVLGHVHTASAARPIVVRLEREARSALRSERHRTHLHIERHADLRYRGQSHELSLPFDSRSEERFHAEHHRRFGICDPNHPVEWVAVRVRAWLSPTRLRSLSPSRPQREPDAKQRRSGATPSRLSCWDERWRRTRVVSRESIRRTSTLRGPAIILEYGATTVLPPGARARLGREGVLEVKP